MNREKYIARLRKIKEKNGQDPDMLFICDKCLVPFEIACQTRQTCLEDSQHHWI